MATQKAPANPRQKYQVLEAYQCPNKKHWHQVGTVLELLPCEADFLLLSGKIGVAKADKSTKGDN